MKIIKLLEESKLNLSDEILEHFKAKGMAHPTKNTAKAVGAYLFKDCLYLFYPKYFKNYESDEGEKEFKIILKSLRKASKAKDDLDILNETSSQTALALELLDDFYSRGLYTPSKKSVGINESSEILWEKSLQEASPILKGGKAYYLDLFTQKEDVQANAFITNLHKTILLDIFKKFKSLIEFLEYPFVDTYSVYELDELREKAEYFLYHAKRQEYSLKDLQTLKLLESYLLKKSSKASINEGNALFTTSFHVLWEETLKSVLGHDEDLKKHIPSPKYKKDGKIIFKSSRLIPDIVFIKKKRLFIIDAKYYDISADIRGELKGDFIGTPDISKQFCYQLCFKDFLAQKSQKVENILIIPSLEEEGFLAKVEFEIFKGHLKLLSLKAKKVFKSYIADERISFEAFLS